MKTFAMAALAGGVLVFAAGAQAADMPYTPAPFTPGPLGTPVWTGFYAGLNAGYSWGDFDATVVATGASTSFDADGFLLGLTAGYNYQIDQLVLGVEGDIGVSWLDGSTAALGGVSAEQDWLGTIRARIGYAVDQILVYGTGGVAFAGVDVTGGGVTDDDTHVGWTIGAGVEVMLTEAWSLKGEYLYVDFDQETYAVPAATNATLDQHAIRFGVNYRFGAY